MPEMVAFGLNACEWLVLGFGLQVVLAVLLVLVGVGMWLWGRWHA